MLNGEERQRRPSREEWGDRRPMAAHRWAERRAVWIFPRPCSNRKEAMHEALGFTDASERSASAEREDRVR